MQSICQRVKVLVGDASVIQFGSGCATAVWRGEVD